MATSLVDNTKIYTTPFYNMTNWGDEGDDASVCVVKGLKHYFQYMPKTIPFVVQCQASGVYTGLGYIYADGLYGFFNLSKWNGSKLFVNLVNGQWQYAYENAPTLTPVTI